MISIINLVKKICQKICLNTFDNSESLCLEKHSISTSNTPNSTVEQVTLQKNIQTYCQTHKDRFWILYYPIVETEVKYLCRKCGSQEDKCKDYILDRVVKSMKAFDVTQESVVFKTLRLFLFEEQQPRQHQEIVFNYADKIHKNYKYKVFNEQKATVLVGNALEACNNPVYNNALHTVLDAYKTYDVEIKLQEICLLAFHNEESIEKDFSKYILDELLHQEKFSTYIKKVVYSRFIDFTRSKSSELIVSDEIEVYVEENESEEEYDDSLLQSLNEEQALLSKLKYGFKLDNKEFVTVIIKLEYKDIDLLQHLTSEEKFYIKLVTKYALKDDSDQLKYYDVPALKESIHIKITQERENLQSYSYSEYEESEKKEIYFKLLYAEALSSKEMGLIFNLTAKQIDKKIENSKKKLKSIL